MGTTLVVVVVVVTMVVAVLPSVVVPSRLPPAEVGGREVLLEAAQAVREVLEISSLSSCCSVLLTDGDISTTAVYKAMVEVGVASGVGVLEWVPGYGGRNTTLDQLSQVVGVARKLRDLCWCLTVVVASEDPGFLGAFARAADEGRLLVWSTRVLLVTSLDLPSLRELLASHWAFSMMNTMVLSLEDDLETIRCGVYVHLPYSSRGAALTVRVASWTPVRGLVTIATDLQLFPEKAANFYGSEVKVVSNPYPPYWMETLETTPEGATIKRYSGRGWLLLEAVARTLNFTVRQLPTQDWAEVMERIKDRSAFISPVVYVVMPHQLETVDYSVFIEPDTLTFSMATPSLTPRWQSLYHPLRPLIWLLILLVLALMPFALFTVSRVVTWESEVRPVTLREAVEEVTATLLGQNLTGHLPSSASVRVLLGAWLAFCLILATAYRGNLTAFLTIPKFPPRVETLHQLIHVGVRATVPMDDGDDLISFFGQSGSRDFQLLAKRTYKVQDTLVGLRQAIEGREAYIYVRKYLEAMIAEHFTDTDGQAKLYVARENISPGFAAWPIVRDAPFKPALDRCLVALLEAGLPEKWMNEMLDHARRQSRIKQRADLLLQKALEESGMPLELPQGGYSSTGVLQPLTLTHMQGPLLLLFLGILLSLGSLGVELLTKWMLRTR